MSTAAPGVSAEQVWRWLDEVADPEIPVISVRDLGIVREVRHADGQWIVTVTPTYSGCPATDVIAQDIRAVLARHGVGDARVETRLSPAWTTDWLTPQAREKLRAYGIAPPAAMAAGEQVIDASRILRAAAGERVRCPRCGSARTERLSEFGSTACKALYRCTACREPFDYFKPH